MPNRPIEFYNRYTKKVELEAVYGEGFLKWAYGSYFGRMNVEIMLKRSFFSKVYGWLMKRPNSQKRIKPFIKKYGVDMRDFEGQIQDYKTFNEFFCRKLRKGAREIDLSPGVAVFPADGRHMGFQNITETQSVFTKGQSFNLEKLLGSKLEAQRYIGGSLILSRLCPVDYHRFHFPVEGAVSNPTLINGYLYSVNPMALRRNLDILFRNKRVKTTIQTQDMGLVTMIEVGATCVGSIIQTFDPNSNISKGEEKGCFEFGGSAAILLFEPGTLQLAQDLVDQSRQGRELYAHMGDILGKSF